MNKVLSEKLPKIDWPGEARSNSNDHRQILYN